MVYHTFGTHRHMILIELKSMNVNS